MTASPDLGSTRAALRLVVLGQWVQAGLALARGAAAGRGLFGGAAALWQVFQAVRLAIALARRLSELRGVPAFAASETQSGKSAALGSAPHSDDPPGAGACLRQALIEIIQSIRDAVGLGRVRSALPRPDQTAGAAAALRFPRALDGRRPPRGLPPDRPPGLGRRPARRRRRDTPGLLKIIPTPLAA